MKRAFRRASLLLLAVLAFVFVATTGCLKAMEGQQQVTAPSSDISPVTNMIQTEVGNRRLRGAVMLLARNNQVIYEKAFGEYSLDTVVPIASASKWISASTIMTLVDDGRLSLDAPISQYLPNFTGKKGTIKLRQLLSHTSGLPGEHRCLSRPAMTLAKCVDEISELSLQADPGKEFRYGGVSFQVAGRIAEVVSGKSWRELFEEKIKIPLNMTHTGYGLVNNPRIAGGASSTVEDYANLLQMHLNNGVFKGKQVLSAASVEEMQRDQTFGVPLAYTPLPDNRRYGLGAWRDLVDSNGRARQISCLGAFGFSPWIDRQRNLLGVFLVRDRLGNVLPLVRDMQQVVRDRLN